MRKLLPLLVAFFLPVFQAAGIIGATWQMQLGNPTGATADPNNHQHYLIQRATEAIDYSDVNGSPNWASWDYTSADGCCVSRTDAYARDTSLPSGFRAIGNGTFGTVNGTSYDRGHLCPSADRLDTTADNTEVFLMSNMMVQDSKNNQGVWNTFEGYCRTLAANQEVLIICGPYNFGSTYAGASHVYIASNLFKIVVCVPLDPLSSSNALSRITTANPSSIRVIAIETPNNDSGVGSWTTYVTSVKKVQQDTGYNFFSALPNNLAWVLRSKVDGQTPAAPGITSFSPSSGTAGASATITGTNLDSTTNVTFNGTVASYTIIATNQITVTVPAGATSGSITVMTLGGRAASSSSFAVTSGGNPDLTLTKAHAGDFTQGDTGDAYSIIVTNAGTATSSGTVTVIDVLPTGLTATDISGTGWSTDLSTLTCTRSDALAASASYPPIIVTVSVATNASASVTNTATVSGGGDVNAANNTAGDPTTIVALTPLQSWQIRYFGSTTSPSAALDADPDGDGMNNQQEFLAGTDPNDSASAFRISNISTEGDDLRITWMTGNGKTNALQSASGEDGYSTNTFTDLFIVTNTIDSTTNYLDLGAVTNAPARYYRVRLVQ
jgi:DNA/RNA endonuclease G (NUC1)